MRPFLESADPWLTEARVVAAHGALHKGQVRPRHACTCAGSLTQADSTSDRDQPIPYACQEVSLCFGAKCIEGTP